MLSVSCVASFSKLQTLRRQQGAMITPGRVWRELWQHLSPAESSRWHQATGALVQCPVGETSRWTFVLRVRWAGGWSDTNAGTRSNWTHVPQSDAGAGPCARRTTLAAGRWPHFQPQSRQWCSEGPALRLLLWLSPNQWGHVISYKGITGSGVLWQVAKAFEKCCLKIQLI